MEPIRLVAGVPQRRRALCQRRDSVHDTRQRRIIHHHTFAGIAPGSVPGFVGAELVGAAIGVLLSRLLGGPDEESS